MKEQNNLNRVVARIAIACTKILYKGSILGGRSARTRRAVRDRARNTTTNPSPPPPPEVCASRRRDLRPRVGAWCLPPNPDKICRRDINSRIQSQQSVYVSRVGSSPRQLPSPPSENLISIVDRPWEQRTKTKKRRRRKKKKKKKKWKTLESRHHRPCTFTLGPVPSSFLSLLHFLLLFFYSTFLFWGRRRGFSVVFSEKDLSSFGTFVRTMMPRHAGDPRMTGNYLFRRLAGYLGRETGARIYRRK